MSGLSIDVRGICVLLQSTERRQKINALRDLTALCNHNDPKEGSVNLLTTFDECYLYLLKCYSDRFESVRDHAARTVTKFIESLPPNDFHLLNVVGTLRERLGQQETVEESEEIRLLFVQQLHTLIGVFVNVQKGHSLQQCYPDIVQVLIKSLHDAYPAVQRECCECVIMLAIDAEPYQFQPYAEPLAKALYGMLNHKHSQARIVAVKALGHVALHIDASGEALSRLLMEVSPLLMDSMPLVRRECGELGTLMLLELRDRYSYFDRIIPLVLCCLKDDSPDVVAYIRPLWVKCGKQYYDENETELMKQELGDVLPANYPPNVQRPTLGCRGIVQRSLRLLKLITRESADWKENVRLHSLKLLYQFVLHAEAAMTAKFFEIYPDVASACRDSEDEVVREAYKVADLMGRLFTYNDWREHGFNGLERSCKEGYLKCFYYMFAEAVGVGFADVYKVAKLLILPEFSQTLKPKVQLYVIKMSKDLLKKCNVIDTTTIEATMEDLNLIEKPENEEMKPLEEVYKNIYIACMKVKALHLQAENDKCKDLLDECNEILKNLAELKKITIAELHENHFTEALKYVDNLDGPLDELSEPILLLNGLLELAEYRAPYMKALQDKLNDVFNFCADEIKIKVLKTVGTTLLTWQQSVNREQEESTKLLDTFLHEVIEPHLTWRAGANAEAMRAMATAALCCAAQGAPEAAREVLPSFAKYMPNLLEDHAVNTRYYAVKCMSNFGKIKMEDMRNISWGVLQRLDDPSADIRELAVLVIPKLSPDFEVSQGAADSNGESSAWESYIKKVFDMLFLHYEGPVVKLKAAIKSTLLELAKTYPDFCKESYKRTLAVCCTGSGLFELQKEFPFSME